MPAYVVICLKLLAKNALDHDHTGMREKFEIKLGGFAGINSVM